MTRVRLFAAIAIALAAALSAAPRAQTPASQTFRVGVDAIPLDVLVLDKQRNPVRGLTQGEFTILENGKPQPIVSFGQVDLAPPVEPSAPWMREAASDVATNDMRFRRLVVILMDNGNTGVNFGEPRSVRLIANAVIDQLGPDDLAAVVYTYLGPPQNFTTDRKKLRAAVDAFQPRNLNLGGSGPGLPLACQPVIGIKPGGCAVDALKHIGDFLRAAPPGRKTLIYVSPGVAFDFSPFGPALSPQMFALRDMFQSLQLANVSVYAIDPTGLQPVARDPGVLDFAENTGGRSIRNDNEAWRQVPDVFRENSSYYLLGYQSTNPVPDGGFRRIEVKVNRPGVEVRSRSGYYAKKPSKPKSSKLPVSAIDEAIGRGLPGGDVPLRVSAAAFAVPGRREADVAVVIGVQGPTEAASTVPSARTVDVVASAFDANWRAKSTFQETVALTPRPGAAGEPAGETFMRLALRPGRYELRVAADSAGRTGSLFLDVEVPDFAKEDLSASGLMLTRAPSSPAASAHLLDGLIPIVPTTARDFARTDRVTAFLRVYRGGAADLVGASVSARILDAANAEVFNQSDTLPPSAFAARRSADYRLELPLSRLRPGDHLLTIAIRSGKRTIQRDVRFHLSPTGS